MFESKLDIKYHNKMQLETLLRSLVVGMMDNYRSAHFKGSYQSTVFFSGQTNVSLSITQDDKLKITIESFSLRDFPGAELYEVSGCGNSGRVVKEFESTESDQVVIFIANILAHCNYYPTKKVTGVIF